MEGSRVGKRENVVSISLNTNDALFSEIADSNISTVPQLLKEKCREIEGNLHPHLITQRSAKIAPSAVTAALVRSPPTPARSERFRN